MSPLIRRSAVVFVALLTAGAAARSRAQVPKPVPGRPYQSWDVLDADGGARKVYFRNDGTVPMTITELVIDRCENTRQRCGTFPANVVVAPGKTVAPFKIERLDRTLGWSYSYSFHTQSHQVESNTVQAPGRVMLMPPDGSAPIAVQTVAIDSLVADVAGWTEGGSCGSVRVLDLPAGYQVLMMVFGTATQPTARRVMVRFDANGSAYDYSDVRHDPNDTTTPPRQTMITLDLMRQQAIVRNGAGGQPPTMFRATGPTLLTAASLGLPGEMIARIVRECGAKQ